MMGIQWSTNLTDEEYAARLKMARERMVAAQYEYKCAKEWYLGLLERKIRSAADKKNLWENMLAVVKYSDYHEVCVYLGPTRHWSIDRVGIKILGFTRKGLPHKNTETLSGHMISNIEAVEWMPATQDRDEVIKQEIKKTVAHNKKFNQQQKDIRQVLDQDKKH